MTDSPRSGAPVPVEELWRTIEDYCERKTGNRRPVRHMARRTGLKKSTISDWFNYRSFPQFEPFSALLRYFDDETWRRDLAIMWQAAWEAHQIARSTGTDRHADSQAADDNESIPADVSQPSARPRGRWPLVAMIATPIVAIAAVYATLRITGADAQQDGGSRQATSTAPAVGIVGGICMVVTARDIRVFTSATGDEPWTTWPRGTAFWVDRDAGSASRSRTTLRNGRHGWVTSDQHFVEPATDCP